MLRIRPPPLDFGHDAPLASRAGAAVTLDSVTHATQPTTTAADDANLGSHEQQAPQNSHSGDPQTQNIVQLNTLQRMQMLAQQKTQRAAEGMLKWKALKSIMGEMRPKAILCDWVDVVGHTWLLFASISGLLT